MKGSGIDLFTSSIILMAIVLVVSLIAFAGPVQEVFGFDCKRQTIDQVIKWVEEMELSTAQPSTGKFLVLRDCVEYISPDGIKLKSEEKVTEFHTSEILNKQKITFDLSGSEKIFPRDAPYDVEINPQQLKIIIRK